MGLKIVKDGDIEVPSLNIEATDAAYKNMTDAVKAGGGFFVVIDYDDGFKVHWVGDGVHMSCIAEEMARETRNEILGID